MPRRTSHPAWTSIFIGVAMTLLPAQYAPAAPHAHDHGVAQLEVALDGPMLTLRLTVPQESLVGFERAPRTPKEQQALAESLGRLREAASLFRPDAAAQCRLEQAQVGAPAAAATKRPGAAEAHPDIDGDYTFRCAQPAQLRALDIGLLDAFPGLKRVVAVVVTAQGQRKFTLRRPARSLPLPR